MAPVVDLVNVLRLHVGAGTTTAIDGHRSELPVACASKLGRARAKCIVTWPELDDPPLLVLAS